jgi:hypothetical protein
MGDGPDYTRFVAPIRGGVRRAFNFKPGRIASSGLPSWLKSAAATLLTPAPPGK